MKGCHVDSIMYAAHRHTHTRGWVSLLLLVLFSFILVTFSPTVSLIIWRVYLSQTSVPLQNVSLGLATVWDGNRSSSDEPDSLVFGVGDAIRPVVFRAASYQELQNWFVALGQACAYYGGGGPSRQVCVQMLALVTLHHILLYLLFVLVFWLLVAAAIWSN